MENKSDIQAGERTQHTPGPWFVRNGDKGYIIRNTRAETKDQIWGIASIWFQSGGKADDSESEANARLIAAAPELLEFAQRFMRWSQKAEINKSVCGGDLFSQAIAAVAKVEGK